MSLLDLMLQKEFDLKIKTNGWYHKLHVIVDGNKLQLHFPYNEDLLKEVKENFRGRKYLGFIEGKPPCWEIPINARNIFRLEVLQGKYASYDPYEQFANVEKYDLSESIKPYFEKRGAKTYKHSIQMINQAIIGRWFVWAAHMGTGKTLAAIIAMEMMKKKYDLNYSFWVGPRSALVAGKLEFRKWRAEITPEFYTYEGIRDLVQKWPHGRTVPQILILDEASKCKNPTAKRTEAVYELAEMMRQTHGYNCLIGLLSGTPAPKSPADWWSLCEIACPGFLREGHIAAFRKRLAITEQRETIPGAGKYEHILGWRDNDKKCDVCGQLEEHVNHAKNGMARVLGQLGNASQTASIHDFKPCKNEISQLKTRMRGLVGVWLKEDCLDLPAKRYQLITVKPSRSILNAAKIIAQTSGRAIEALTRLRELSDGFQYEEVETGNMTECPSCNGRGVITEYHNPANPGMSFSDDEIREGVRFIWSEPSEMDDPETFESQIIRKDKIEIIAEEVTCFRCKGVKRVKEMRRTVVECECPKDQVLIDLLEEHEEDGRLNIYAGFTGSIERIIRICRTAGWGVIRADGRGWEGYQVSGQRICDVSGIPLKSEDLMQIYMQGATDEYPYLAFVGQPGAAGMGLTLTVSPSTFFYSNDFNGENREQAEDRGHRIGMDVVWGGRIIDVVHLPTDRQVLDNLKVKKDLQYLAMKGVISVLETSDGT